MAPARAWKLRLTWFLIVRNVGSGWRGPAHSQAPDLRRMTAASGGHQVSNTSSWQSSFSWAHCSQMAFLIFDHLKCFYPWVCGINKHSVEHSKRLANMSDECLWNCYNLESLRSWSNFQLSSLATFIRLGSVCMFYLMPTPLSCSSHLEGILQAIN